MNQIVHADLVYYVEQQDGTEHRVVDQIALRYFYEDQLRELLSSAGFTIMNEMGYYDGRPIAEGPELIFVCEKSR